MENNQTLSFFKQMEKNNDPHQLVIFLAHLLALVDGGSGGKKNM
jgi:hypothetical protein